jgi:hypothetical protein
VHASLIFRKMSHSTGKKTSRPVHYDVDGGIRFLKTVHAISAARTISTENDSNKLFDVTGGPFTITLPDAAMSKGMHVAFRFSAATYTFVETSGGTVIKYSEVVAATASWAFVAAVDDEVEFVCDGTYWVGHVHRPGAINSGTLTTTGNITSSAGNIVATTGHIAASAGSVSANTSVTAGSSVSAGTTIGSGGSITSGASISATTTVTAGTGLRATAGGLVVTAGLSEVTDIAASAGIVATTVTLNTAGGVAAPTAAEWIDGYIYDGAAGAGATFTTPTATTMQTELAARGMTSAAGLQLRQVLVRNTDNGNNITVTAGDATVTIHGTAAVGATNALLTWIMTGAATATVIITTSA